MFFQSGTCHFQPSLRLAKPGERNRPLKKLAVSIGLIGSNCAPLPAFSAKGPGPGVTQQSSDQFPGNGVTGWLGVGATKLGPCQRAGLDAVGHLAREVE